MLSPDQITKREGRLTASRVSCLMTGNEAQILNLWRELVGDPGFVPEDLSGVWPVQLGIATEQLNLDWFERKHGSVSRRGDVVIGQIEWMAATLDGWSDQYNCVVEAKHCGGREPLETIIDRYQPQMQWQMLVTGAKQCALSVIMGASEPIVEFIPFDAEYAKELSCRAHAFMLCVETLTPPVAVTPAAAPIVAKVEHDMSGNNAWASEAFTWLENFEAKKKAEWAERELKFMVPADAARCFGHGVEIKRARNGNLSLRECRK